MTANQTMVYHLRLALRDIDPPIWRSLVVPNTITLAKLHRVFQVTMGWQFCHLHQFVVGDELRGTHYGEPFPGEGKAPPIFDHRRIPLRSIASKIGDTFLYEYDFGDSWWHMVTVEAMEPLRFDSTVPWCLDGQRACPPEDCGGVRGYQGLLDDQPFPLEMWAGPFEPEVFSVSQANSALALLVSLEGPLVPSKRVH